MIRLLCPVLLCVVALSFVSACSDKPAAPSEAAETKAPDHTYEVRGVLVAVKPGGKTLSIHHEAIPEFVHITGKADGMAEMVMDLEVAEGEDVSALEPGDKISFKFAGYWEPLPAKWWIENIQKLPADTVMNLKDAETPQLK